MDRLGRWLAYADFCVNAEEQLARCQPFWNFVGIVLGIVCLVTAIAVTVKIIRDRGKARGSYNKTT